MSWTCSGHYKVHVHEQDSPGRPVHGHCPIPLPALVKSMVRKKNKRHIQSTPSANKTQSRSFIVTDTELQKLIRQGLVVDEVHEVLSYD